MGKDQKCGRFGKHPWKQQQYYGVYFCVVRPINGTDDCEMASNGDAVNFSFSQFHDINLDVSDWTDHGQIEGPEVSNPLLMIKAEDDGVFLYWRSDLTQEERYDLSAIIQADLKRRSQ